MYWKKYNNNLKDLPKNSLIKCLNIRTNTIKYMACERVKENTYIINGRFHYDLLNKNNPVIEILEYINIDDIDDIDDVVDINKNDNINVLSAHAYFYQQNTKIDIEDISKLLQNEEKRFIFSKVIDVPINYIVIENYEIKFQEKLLEHQENYINCNNYKNKNMDSFSLFIELCKFDANVIKGQWFELLVTKNQWNKIMKKGSIYKSRLESKYVYNNSRRLSPIEFVTAIKNKTNII